MNGCGEQMGQTDVWVGAGKDAWKDAWKYELRWN